MLVLPNDDEKRDYIHVLILYVFVLCAAVCSGIDFWDPGVVGPMFCGLLLPYFAMMEAIAGYCNICTRTSVVCISDWGRTVSGQQ
jgi:hypothetical protein